MVGALAASIAWINIEEEEEEEEEEESSLPFMTMPLKKVSLLGSSLNKEYWSERKSSIFKLQLLNQAL
ncbi:hypothetical protein TorRG33x02_048450 [Trema orientale]|uniref:Uncharacterized protein n=1 Tax=Trema orientale TaxID=63057 RepID=A0A2P5FNC7_TREOI|nr:hypothetical protein TorRG33x02_048450 [Trema orientale]